MTRRPLGRRLAVLGLALALATAILPSGGAGAGEVYEGTTLVSATVTGPGITEPVVLSDAAGTDLAKSWAASATFSKPGEQPPADAPVYKVRMVLQNAEVTGSQHSSLRFAWDGSHGWFSRGRLLRKGTFLPAPIVAVAAMKPVLDAASSGSARPTGGADAASSTDDSGTSTALVVVGGLAIAALLAGGFVWLRQRRRGRSTAATA